MTEKGTPSETPRIEHLPSGLAMLCRPNGSCRPATKEELFFDSENSRLRDELAAAQSETALYSSELKCADEQLAKFERELAETERKYLDAWRESQTERAAAVAAARELEKKTAALEFYATKQHFMIVNDMAWDMVSGEPSNFWCDEAETATVEDGWVARAALQPEDKHES